MKLYIAKNNLCDPARNVGIAKQFALAKDIDEYIKFFVASIQPRYLSNWRILITNDDIGFEDIDHYLLFDEKIGLEFTGNNKIKEVNIIDIAKDVNEAFQRRERAREQAKALADKERKSFDVV